MSKDFAWQLFKNTGNVDAFMIMRNIENGSNMNANQNLNNDVNSSVEASNDVISKNEHQV